MVKLIQLVKLIHGEGDLLTHPSRIPSLERKYSDSPNRPTPPTIPIANVLPRSILPHYQKTIEHIYVVVPLNKALSKS